MSKCVKCQNIYPQALGHQCGSVLGSSTLEKVGPSFIEYYGPSQPPPTIASAIKSDSDKLDLSMLPPEGLEEATKAFMDGMKKYGRHQYRSGMEWSRLVSAMMRHINQFNKGEDRASDSGVHHLGHVIANCMMLLDYYYNNLGTDNRRTHSTKQDKKDKL